MTIESKPLSIPRNGLVAEYLLDGNALDTNDGTKNNGTATNVTYANTYVGYQKQAGVFNGSSSGITIGGLPASINDNDFSISFSARFNSVSAGRVFYFQDRDSSVELSSGTIRLVLYDGNINNVSYGVSAGVDYHFSFIRNRSTGLSLYVNGELKASSNFTGVASFQAGGTTIGRHKSFNLEYLNGSLQSVRLYNRALSSQEIQTLYLEGKRMIGNYGNPDLFKDCVAYYDFKGDANDVIGGNNGTVNGATLTTDRFGMANSAYSFSLGSNIYLGNSTLISNGTNTLSCLVKLDTLSHAIIAMRGGILVDWGFVIEYKTTTGFSFGTNTAPTDNQINSNFHPAVGEWNHICAVFSSSGFMRFYVNGNLVGSISCGTTLRSNGTIGWTFGNGNSPASYPLIGGLSDVQLSYSVPTDNEVKALYQASLSQKPYPFTKRLTGSLTQGVLMDLENSFDQSGNGNNGTDVNSPTVSRRLQAVGRKYNGSNQYTTVPDSNSLDLTSAYTLSLNLEMSSLPSSGNLYSLLFKRDSGGNFNGYEFELWNDSGTQKIFVSHANGSTAATYIINYALPTGRPINLSARFSGSTLDFFLNGKIIGTVNSVTVVPTAGTGTLSIGRNTAASGRLFSGNLYSARIWNRALSGEEIQQLFHSTYLQ